MELKCRGAARMASVAVAKLLEGKSNLVICEQNNEIVALDKYSEEKKQLFLLHARKSASTLRI